LADLLGFCATPITTTSTLVLAGLPVRSVIVVMGHMLGGDHLG